jgi:hypothetical protein
LEYIIKNYQNVPELMPIKDYSIMGKYDGKDIVYTIVEQYKSGNLINYLGDMIVSYYKKEKDEQSLWSTDCSRLNYVIRAKIGEKLNWCLDKRGVNLCNIIIDPLLKYIREELEAYVFSVKGNLGEMYEINKRIIIGEIIEKIDNSCIGDNLLRYIAPYFNFMCEEKME